MAVRGLVRRCVAGVAGARGSGGRRDCVAVLFQSRCGLGCVGTVFLWKLWTGHASVVGEGSGSSAKDGGSAIPVN